MVLGIYKPKNKHRLYLALYARAKDPGTYHYALLISPKNDIDHPGSRETTKHHCKNILRANEAIVTETWIYESISINPDTDPQILARVLIAKLYDPDDTKARLAAVEILQGSPDYSCRTWISHALSQLNKVETCNTLDWALITQAALQYVSKKKDEGRYDVGWKGDTSRVPTFDMLSHKELVP